MNQSENQGPDPESQPDPAPAASGTEISSDAATDATSDGVFVAKLVGQETDAGAVGDALAETAALDPAALHAETGQSTTAEPVAAGEVPVQAGESIREGSPFRADPPAMLVGDFSSGEGAYLDLGPYRYTAMGAATSALLITAFAGLGAWWFPAGGVVVAMLGALLSIVGMYSPNRLRLVSIAALVFHAGLFLLSYQRAIG